MRAVEFSAEQVALEQEMADRGVERYWAKVNTARGGGKETTTAAGRYLLRETVGRVHAALRRWKRTRKERPGPNALAYEPFCTLDLKVAALLGTQFAIDTVTQGGVPYSTAAIALGKRLENDACLRFCKKHDPNSTINWQRTYRHRRAKNKAKSARRLAAEAGWVRWRPEERSSVGVVVLSAVEETGLVEHVTRKAKRGAGYTTRAYLRMTEETIAWLQKSHARHAVLEPFFLPMLCEPLDWAGMWDGGYLTDLARVKPLIATRRAHLEEAERRGVGAMLPAVNALQRTAWRVNDAVLEVADHFWQANVPVATLLSREPEVPPPFPDPAPRGDALKAWKKRAALVHERNEVNVSRRLLALRTLDLARKYRDRSFWLPWSLDFRGRFYPIPPFLQPQGPSLSRGLMAFAEGAWVTPANDAWFRVHGANCWGEKGSFIHRMDWMDGRAAELRELYRDPLASRWWEEADKPWEFLAWALEAGELLEEGRVASRVPVAMDGSNNGLQLYSLLLRDPDGARATNCAPAEADEEPRDIYQDVADRVTERLRWLATHPDHADSRLGREWLGFFPEGSVPRACTKRPVMTLPYGSTLHSCQRYVTQWFEEQLEEGRESPWGDMYWKQCGFLAGRIWTAIQDTVGPAIRCMAWLQACANIATDHGVALRWTAPAGMPVKQGYTLQKHRRIRTVIGDAQVRWTTLRKGTDRLAKRQQSNGIAPNFIHSLDAALMARVVNRCRDEGMTRFAMVHDSFGCPAPEAAAMAGVIRDEAARLFETDHLENFRREVQEKLPRGIHLPEPPPRGSFDTNQVRRAAYLFS